MFPAIYQYDIGIYPDFEADKTYVKGTFLVKGHIRLVHVLISGIRLLKERDIRNFIKKFLSKEKRKAGFIMADNSFPYNSRVLV